MRNISKAVCVALVTAGASTAPSAAAQTIGQARFQPQFGHVGSVSAGGATTGASGLGSLELSPSGALLVSAGAPWAALWDTRNGKLLRTFGGTTRFATFSRDGKSIYVEGAPNEHTFSDRKSDLGIIDIGSGKRKSLGTVNNGSPDSSSWREILGASARHALWFAEHRQKATGHLQAEWVDDPAAMNRWTLYDAVEPGKKHTVSGVPRGVTPDGRFALIAHADPAGDSLLIVELATGKTLHTIPMGKGFANPYSRTQLTADGGRAAFEDQKLVDLRAGRRLPDRPKDAPRCAWVAGCELWNVRPDSTNAQVLVGTDTVDGRYAAVGTMSGGITLHDLRSGAILQRFGVDRDDTVLNEIVTQVGGNNFHTHAPHDRLAFLPGNKLAAGTKVWDLNVGAALPGELDRHLTAISPTGKYGFVDSQGTIRRVDMSAPPIATAADKGEYPGQDCVSTPDGSRVLCARAGLQVILLDGASGRQLASLEAVSAQVPLAAEATLSPALSADGKLAAATENTGGLSLWDTTTRKRIGHVGPEKFGTNAYNAFALAFSPDGSTLAAIGRLGVHVWDVPSLKNMRRIDPGSPKELGALAFSPDGTQIAAGLGDGDIKLIDVKTGKVVRTLKGHTDGVVSLAFNASGTLLASRAADYTTRLWHLADDDVLTLLWAGSDWLMYSREGYFDASRDGGRLMAIVDGTTAYGVDQFAARLNRPDLLLKKAGLGTPEAIEHFRAAFEHRIRRLGFTEDQLSAELHAPTVRLDQGALQGRSYTMQIQASDERVPLKSYNVFVNDVPLFGAAGKPLSGNSGQVTETFALTGGNNKIEASATNTMGAESPREQLTVTGVPEAQGDLWYLGFGVSSYRNKDLNLGYAAKDAKDLASVFRAAAGKTFREVHVKTLLDEEVTTKSIVEAKSFLAKAGPDDTFVLFVAGHGVHLHEKGNPYYYVTHDVDVRNLSGTAARFELIEELLQGIAPRKKLFLLDTCESGEADESPASRPAVAAGNVRARTTRALELAPAQGQAPRRSFLDARERYIYNDVLRRSGAIVFSSSRANEVSHESDELKNGYFTKEVVTALTTDLADANKDRLVSSEELRAYVSRAVATRSGQTQHPTVDRDNIFQKLGFPIVTPAPEPSATPSASAPAAKPAAPPVAIPPRRSGCACELSVHGRPASMLPWPGAFLVAAALVLRRNKRERNAHTRHGHRQRG